MTARPTPSVALEERSPRLVERLPLRLPWWAAFAIVVALSLFAWWLRAVLAPDLPPGFPFVTFFPVVLLSAFFLGTRAGILAALLCGLIAWHRFVSPTHDWSLNAGGRVAMGFYLFITTTEVLLTHFMQRANRELAAERAATARLATTRALMFRELQHRVSNNLQVAASLISMQRRSVRDPEARTALEEASRRIGVIGRIGRQLHDPDGNERPLAAFLDELARDVVDASGRDDVRVRIAVAPGADAPLAPDQAVPLALIVAEAIANAIEHGFADARPGIITVGLARIDEGHRRITVADDGRGLPDGFDLAASDSLGLKIAGLLAKQVRGRFALLPGATGGSIAELVLPDA